MKSAVTPTFLQTPGSDDVGFETIRTETTPKERIAESTLQSTPASNIETAPDVMSGTSPTVSQELPQASRPAQTQEAESVSSTLHEPVTDSAPLDRTVATEVPSKSADDASVHDLTLIPRSDPMSQLKPNSPEPSSDKPIPPKPSPALSLGSSSSTNDNQDSSDDDSTLSLDTGPDDLVHVAPTLEDWVLGASHLNIHYAEGQSSRGFGLWFSVGSHSSLDYASWPLAVNNGSESKETCGDVEDSKNESSDVGPGGALVSFDKTFSAAVDASRSFSIRDRRIESDDSFGDVEDSKNESANVRTSGDPVYENFGDIAVEPSRNDSSDMSDSGRTEADETFGDAVVEDSKNEFIIDSVGGAPELDQTFGDVVEDYESSSTEIGSNGSTETFGDVLDSNGES